jgi:hypothetical protein
MSTHSEALEDIKKAKEALDSIRPEQGIKHPDAKKHLYVSLAKSFIRITAGVCLVVGFPIWCGVGLIVAEALGIVEELV